MTSDMFLSALTPAPVFKDAFCQWTMLLPSLSAIATASGRPVPVIEGLLAATALHHERTLDLAIHEFGEGGAEARSLTVAVL